MSNLNVNIAGVDFKNPVITASGTFGFGRDYECLYPVETLGGISLKGMTLEKREGNASPRIAETKAGMLNSVGLQNPGVDSFIKNDLDYLSKQDTVLIANVAGKCIEDYQRICEKLSDTAIHMIELNISCPNVKQGGVAFGTNACSAAEITKAVKKYCKKPLIVKLSPNVTDIAEIAKAVESEGADSVSLINTLLGMKIDTKTKRPVLKNNVGGLSGPCVFPVALRMVWQVANAVKVPVIGMGGIESGDEAIQMFLAGASAIQVGAAMFNDPYAPVKIIKEIDDYLEYNGYESVNDIIGKVEIY